MDRLSPVGADAKSLRREAKRGYELALAAGMVKMENMESPPKKVMPEKPKPKGAPSTGTSAAAKKKALRHQQVAQLQGVVDGIQQQVDAASKGIQELKELVHAHLVGRSTSPESEPYVGTIACVSPPASLMADAQEDCIFEEFPAHPDALVYYGDEPMPFSC